MIAKEYEVQKKIQKVSKKWLSNLGLGWWRVTHEYCRKEQPPTELAYNPPTTSCTYKSIRCRSCYLKLKVRGRRVQVS